MSKQGLINEDPLDSATLDTRMHVFSTPFENGPTHIHPTAYDPVPDPHNPVSKPAHYNAGEGVECIVYIKQVLGLEGFVAYCRGNVMKYNHRAMYKGNPSEDLAKAAQYLEWVNDTLKQIYK